MTYSVLMGDVKPYSHTHSLTQLSGTVSVRGLDICTIKPEQVQFC